MPVMGFGNRLWPRQIRGIRPEIEAGQSALGVGQVADDFSKRQGSFPYNRRKGDNLVYPSGSRILYQIDDFDMVASGEMLFADLF